MTDLAKKVLSAQGTLVEHSRNSVMLHEYEGKKYYVKTLPLDAKTFKVLLSFKLLEYMGVKIPNITTIPTESKYNEELYVLSEECGQKTVASLGEIPNDPDLQKEIAKIIYISDFLGLGDIANDNIIQSGKDLYLIDFETMGTNAHFGTLNPYGMMGDDDYSIARSFDLHNAKGNPTKTSELPKIGAKTRLSLDETSKIEIEEKFFSLDGTKLKEIIDSVLKEQFPKEFIEKDLDSIKKELTARYLELYNAKNQTIIEEEFVEVANPQHANDYFPMISNETDTSESESDSTLKRIPDEVERDRIPQNFSFVRKYVKSNHQTKTGKLHDL